MAEKDNYVCCGSTTLIFSCSGAADTAEITDRVARSLTKEGVGKMYCLAGIGGKINPILVQTKAADRILAIDGCPLDCAKRTLEEGGFQDFQHFRVTDLGMEKGKSPATAERIALAVNKAKELLV